MDADIALGEGPEDGVDERMQHHVGVGVTANPALMRDAHAAQHHVIAGAELVEFHAAHLSNVQAGDAFSQRVLDFLTQ